MRVEQEQRVTEDARISAEQDAAAQRYAVHVLQVLFFIFIFNFYTFDPKKRQLIGILLCMGGSMLPPFEKSSNSFSSWILGQTSPS